MKITVILIAVVTYVVGSAILVVWMVAAATFAGVLMWDNHYDVTGTRWFILVRRYGLLGAARRGLWNVVTRRATIEDIGDVKKLAVFIMTPPLVGFMAPVLCLALVRFTLLPPRSQHSPLGDALSNAILLTGSLGAVCGTWVWLRGLSYIAKPYAKRRRLPRLRVPVELNRRSRDLLAINIFWREQTRTAYFFASMYPFLILMAMSATLDPSAFSEPSPVPPSTDSGMPILITLLIMFLFLAPSLVPARTAAKWVQRRFADSQAAEDLCSVLRFCDPETSAPELIDADVIQDSMEMRRTELARVGELLHQAAGQLDAQQPPGFTPHPTATIFRGIVQKIRQHLSSPNAYDAQIPEKLTETLRLTLLVLAGACGVNDYKALAAHVSAFDDTGNPSVELFTKPPGRLARLYEWMTATVTRTAALVAGLTTLAVPVTAVFLAVLGKIQIEPLLHLLK